MGRCKVSKRSGAKRVETPNDGQRAEAAAFTSGATLAKKLTRGLAIECPEFEEEPLGKVLLMLHPKSTGFLEGLHHQIIRALHGEHAGPMLERMTAESKQAGNPHALAIGRVMALLPLLTTTVTDRLFDEAEAAEEARREREAKAAMAEARGLAERRRASQAGAGKAVA